MTDETATAQSPQSPGQVLDTLPELQDQQTLEGLAELVAKAAPLIQGRRLHNVIDLLAATHDVIEMADESMVEKVMAAYEQVTGSGWAVGNAVRYASAQAAQEETPPTVWQSLRRLNRDEDARRGLSVAINLAAELGRQSRANHGAMPED